MTVAVNWLDLGLQTLRDPKAAAAEIMGWQLPRDALWMAAAVVVILSTIMSYLSNYIIPMPEPFTAVAAHPFRLFMTTAGIFIISIHMLFWIGRALGGSGDMTDLLALFVWLQALRAAAQVLVLITVIVVPFLAAFLVLFILAATIWVLLNFTSAGLQLNSLSRAAMVCLIALFAIAFAIALIIPVVGISAFGVPANV